MAAPQRARWTAAVAAALLIAAGAVRAQDPPKPTAKPASVAGKWTLSLETSQFTSTPTLELKQDGEKLTGTYTGRYAPAAVEGTIKDRAVSFWLTIDAEGTKAEMDFKGEVSADGMTMKGTAQIEGLGDATWSAKRVPTA